MILPDRLDHATALALLQWQVELGADEALGDAPVNRYATPPREPAPAAPVAAAPASVPAAPTRAALEAAPAPAVDPVAEATRRAAASATLADLAEAMRDFDLCELKRGARSMVFADGRPGARVMVIGEAPGAEEDREGRPFVGPAGRLLDRMFAAIGLDRSAPGTERALYITNVLPWRPPMNRAPTVEEIAMFRPFLARHVELAAPELVVLMGNSPCAAVLGRTGILGLRGQWTQALDRPVMPMTHPSYLLRKPDAKRAAWADLLEIQARLRTPR